MLTDSDKALVKVLGVSAGMRLAPSGVTRTRTVNFAIGDRGPFSVSLDVADYTPDAVWALIEKEFSTLRGIGAL